MIKHLRKHNPDLTIRAKELRKNMTPEERRLWHCFLKTYAVRTLRQKVIDDYIVDFKSMGEFLIDHGAHINHRDHEGNTPLHIAVDNSRIDITDDINNMILTNGELEDSYLLFSYKSNTSFDINKYWK